MTANTVIGFVGLGVMGGPMCRNMALKHSGEVIAFDMNAQAFASLEGTKARRAESIAKLAAQCDVIFLSLPGGSQVEQVCIGVQGLTSGPRKPSCKLGFPGFLPVPARLARALLLRGP